MLDSEVRDIITNDLIEFLDSYLMMTTLTHEGLNSEYVEGQYIKFGVVSNSYYNNNFKHAIFKVGRTKLKFSFKFYKDELDFAMRLVRLLDGYVEYKFQNWTEHYNYDFVFDVGSKANCKKMFDKLTRK